MQEFNTQAEIFIENESDDLFSLAEIVGSNITLGIDSNNISAVNKGLSIFQDNREVLKTSATEDKY